jgi:diguanylate cyclase (GGDEF)-like protein
MVVSVVVAALVAAIVACALFFSEQVAVETARAVGAGSQLNDLSRTTQALQWGVVICGVLAVLVALGLPFVLMRSLVDRLESLERAARAMALGETGFELDASGSDEVADLTKAFMTLRKSLDATAEQLRLEAQRRAEGQRRLEEAAEARRLLSVELEERALERERMDAELNRANDRLETRLAEVATVTEEMTILAEMGSMLQSDIGSLEAYEIVSRYAAVLLPGTAGALYVMAPSRNMLDRAAVWGDGAPKAPFFGPSDCWSLRLGRTFVPDEEHVEAVCEHVGADDHGSNACIPLTAQGDVLGVLVFYNLVVECSLDADDTAKARRRGLAVTLAEHVALALSNLALRESLREQSIKDPLTGLYNRRYMEDTVEREVARSLRTGTPISFVMMDVDHFKDYNDRIGHAAGDAALSALGSYLQSVTRADDIVCRYGGEEFFLAMPGADVDSATIRADEIRRGVRELVLTMDGQVIPGITVSMGIAQFEGGAESSAHTLAAADRALYVAKSGGRDRVRKATEADHVAPHVQGTTGYEYPEELAEAGPLAAVRGA